MGDTGNDLNLEFYIHGWGSNIGILTVWIDDASTSNSADATILGQFSGTHSGSFVSGTSTLSSQGTNNTTVKLGGTQNGSATFTGTSSNWVKAELRLNNYRTVDADHYIYFVYIGDTSYRGDLAVDDVSFIETE